MSVWIGVNADLLKFYTRRKGYEGGGLGLLVVLRSSTSVWMDQYVCVLVKYKLGQY